MKLAMNRLEKSFSFWFLIFISFLFFLLRWPSLFEPYWYGDEGVYQAVGMLIRNGESLYSGAWENKPPLLLVIYALLNSDQFLIRCVSLISGVLSIWFLFLISKRLFPDSFKTTLVSTSIYVFLFGTNFLEGNIANAENFMLLPIMISAYLIVCANSLKKEWQLKIYFLAGLILSMAFLTKVVAVFDFLAFGLFLLFVPGINLRDKVNQKIFPFSAGFGLPVALTAFYFLITNNFRGFMDAFVLRNIGYVEYSNQLIIPQGLLILKLFLLFSFLFFLYRRKEKIGKPVLFILIWFSFSFFNVYFSGRPYTHYLLVILPSFSLLTGVLISEQRERLFSAFLLIFAVLIISKTFVLKPEKIIPYYINLISFCLDKKSVADYQSFFDRRTPRDYLLASYIRSNTTDNERVFIWGNNAQVYKLANRPPIFRYTVAYHTINFPNGILEMEKAIETKKPKYVIIMPNVPPFPLPLSGYNEKMNIEQMVIYEKIF